MKVIYLCGLNQEKIRDLILKEWKKSIFYARLQLSQIFFDLFAITITKLNFYWKVKSNKSIKSKKCSCYKSLYIKSLLINVKVWKFFLILANVINNLFYLITRWVNSHKIESKC